MSNYQPATSYNREKYDRIIDYLRLQDQNISADELYIIMRSNNEKISISTIYRHLAMLISHGMVNTQSLNRCFTQNLAIIGAEISAQVD